VIVYGIAWLPLPGEAGNLVNLFLSSVGGSNLDQVMVEGFLRRINWPGTLITLIALGTLVLSLLFYEKQGEKNADQDSLPDRFMLLLVLAGFGLVLLPEFIFLRDLFGYRINTIFKFYYQTWLMWSLVAAYGTILLFRSLRSWTRYLIFTGLILSMVMALFYPVISIQSKTNNFNRPAGITLDGSSIYPPSDAEGAAWLSQAPFGVIAEAVGGSYSSSHARMATYSGKPNVLGWDFHEIQWRGDGSLVWPRKEKMAAFYCARNWQDARAILMEFQIRYVVVGDVEYSTYAVGSENCPSGISINKFADYLIPVFQNERLIIYQVPDLLAE
jgi:uncharacterized membrane protein